MNNQLTKVIFATGPRGQFGLNGQLPWNEPQDMEIFKEFTKDAVVLMGRGTFESLPFALPGRVNVVVTTGGDVTAKNGDKPNARLRLGASGLIGAVTTLKKVYGKDVVIIGGADLIKQAVKIADVISISEIDTNCEADVFLDLADIYRTVLDERELECLSVTKDFGEHVLFTA